MGTASLLATRRRARHTRLLSNIKVHILLLPRLLNRAWAALPFYRHVLLALAALVAAWVPALVAIDHGGVLPYDWWLVSQVAIALTLGVLIDAGAIARHRLWGYLPALLLLLFAAFAWAQSLRLPGAVVELASPGAAAAYQQWLPPALGEAAPELFPISLSRDLTVQFAARAVVIAAFAFAAAILFVNRDRLRILLYGLCFAGLLHAAVGILHQAEPVQSTVDGAVTATVGHPFGFFVNRNNAAGLINVGLAAAVGLIVFRVVSVLDATSTSPASRGFAYLEDVPLWFASVAAVVALAGILASGSRGGLLAALAGAGACLLLVVPPRRAWIASAGVATMLGTAWLSLFLLGVGAESVDRLAASDAAALVDDGRLEHWPDAWRAAKTYFPLGAGMGAYRYAYLPYQQSSHADWYQHADNLWIEWLVEGGTVAAIVCLAGLMLVVFALGRLRGSADPVDRGLAATGCYGVTAMLVSQSFDFALVQPATAIGAAMIVSAIVARAALQPASAKSGDSGLVWLRSLATAMTQRTKRLVAPHHEPSPASGRESQWSRFATSFVAFVPAQRMSAPQTLAASRLRLLQPPARPGYRPVWIGAVVGAVVLGAAAVASDSLATAAHGDVAVRASQLVRSNALRRLDEMWAAEAALSDYLHRAPEDHQARLERMALRAKMYRVLKTAQSERVSKSQIRQAYARTQITDERRRYYASGDGASDSPRPGEGQTSGRDASRIDGQSYTIDFSTPRLTAATMLPFLRPAAEAALAPPTAIALSEGNRFEAGMGNASRPLDYLLAAAEDARRALRVAPLSDLPRMWLVWLDYATGETQWTESRLVQTAALRSRSPDQLRRIGSAAAVARHQAIARSAWRQALSLRPTDLSPLLREVRSTDGLAINQIIPPTRPAILAAARVEIRERTPDRVVLSRAHQLLAAEQRRGERHTAEDAELLQALEAR